MKKIYTAKQIADIFQVSVETVWRWFRNGKLKYYVVSRKKMVSEEQLKEFMGDEKNGK